jgi:hypothetical protein
MYRVVAPKVAHSVTVRNVAVIGTGYEGLTLRASLARQNYQPERTGNSLERRTQLAEGYVAVSEAELTELAEGMLAAETTPVRAGQALAASQAEIIPHLRQPARLRSPDRQPMWEPARLWHEHLLGARACDLQSRLPCPRQRCRRLPGV